MGSTLVRSLLAAAFSVALLLAGCASSNSKPANSLSPDFSLVVTPSTISIQAGGPTEQISVTASSLNGFTAPVIFGVSGLPAGVTASPAAVSVQSGISQTITIAASRSVIPGPATVSVTGTSGSLSHSASVGLTLTPASDFSLNLAPAAITLVPGGSPASATFSATAVNGFTGPVAVTLSGLPNGVAAAPASFTLTPGTPQQISFTAASTDAASTAAITFNAAAGGITHSAALALTITAPPPDFSLQLNPAALTLNPAGIPQSVNITATALNGFSGQVSVVLSGLPADVAAAPASLTLTPGVAQAVNLTANPNALAGPGTLNLTATSGNLSHDASLGLTIAPSIVTRGLIAFFPANEGSGNTLSSTVGGYQATLGGAGNTWSPIGVVLNGSGYISLPPALNSAITVQMYVSQPNNPNVYVGSPNFLTGTGGSANTQWVLGSQLTTPCCPGFQPGTMVVASSSVGSSSDTPFAGQDTLSLVMGLASNATDDVFYIGADEVVFDQNVASAVGGYQTGGNYLTGQYLQGTLGPSAYYNVQLTPDEIAQNVAYFNTLMRSRGIQNPSNINLESVNQFVAFGDSITYGWDGPRTYCSFVAPNNAYGVTCLGQGGAETALGAAQAPQIALWDATNAKRNIFFDDYITNDVRFSVPAATSVANLAQACQEIKQIYPNAMAVVGTMLSLGGFDSVKDTTNPLIRQMATDGQSGCDGFIDMASDPLLGADGASLNTTYFNPGALHPTNAGYGEMGGIITRYINSVDGATLDAPTVVSANSYAMTTADNFVHWAPTAPATGTLPECIGMLGTPTRGVFTIENTSSGVNTITMSGLGSESISGAATIAPNQTASFEVLANSDAAGGCTWVRK